MYLYGVGCRLIADVTLARTDCMAFGTPQGRFKRGHRNGSWRSLLHGTRLLVQHGAFRPQEMICYNANSVLFHTMPIMPALHLMDRGMPS
jgi:hypothetical protein